VLGASLAISYYEVRRSAQLSAGDRLSRLSHSLASLMEQQTSTKLGLMRRISTDSAVQAAFSTPNRAPSAAAIRTMSAIRLPSDSLTPPMLWTPDGHIIGTLRLEQATDVDQFRSTIATPGALSDSEYVGKIVSVNGHGSL